MDDQALQPDRVPPFGYPRIVVCLRLPEAFRRFLRPSSALYAKTSTVRSYSFNHKFSFAFTRTVQTFILRLFDLVIFVLQLSERPICLSSVIQFSKNCLSYLFRDPSKLTRKFHNRENVVCPFRHHLRTSFSLERR